MLYYSILYLSIMYYATLYYTMLCYTIPEAGPAVPSPRGARAALRNDPIHDLFIETWHNS